MMTTIFYRTKPDFVSDPSYSPDGGTIVFAEKIGTIYKISTLTIASTPVYTVLLSGSQKYADPFYSADGFFIVFAMQTGAISGPHPYGAWSLNYMYADGSGLTTILDDGNANLHPCWVTPTQIGFQFWQYGVSTAFRVALIDLAGQGRMEIGEGEYPRAVTA